MLLSRFLNKKHQSKTLGNLRIEKNLSRGEIISFTQDVIWFNNNKLNHKKIGYSEISNTIWYYLILMMLKRWG